ncbi:MAG: hypothetical protein HQ522_03155 [Bacteroidetes bacterium]|nr:hypothetical protein [Bacteroidota bacterium]
MEQESTESGFWSWFAEKISTHPKLSKRLIHLNKIKRFDTIIKKPEPIKIKEIVSSHSSYMP